MTYLGAQKLAISRDSVFLKWKYWVKCAPSLIGSPTRTEINLMDSLTVLPVNITSTEILKQMACLFHYAEALATHPVVCLPPPNGLRTFKKSREGRVHCFPSFLSLKAHWTCAATWFWIQLSPWSPRRENIHSTFSNNPPDPFTPQTIRPWQWWGVMDRSWHGERGKENI